MLIYDEFKDFHISFSQNYGSLADRCNPVKSCSRYSRSHMSFGKNTTHVQKKQNKTKKKNKTKQIQNKKTKKKQKQNKKQKQKQKQKQKNLFYNFLGRLHVG